MTAAAFYRRIPNRVNLAGCKDEGETIAEMLGRFCKRCGHELVWREDITNLFCPACAWSPSPKEEAEEEKVEKVDLDKVVYY